MRYTPHVKALLRLGLPIIVAQIGIIVQGLADTLMVGRFSTPALAASGFVNNLMNLILLFALGYSYAITPLTGANFARGQYRECTEVLKAAVRGNLLLGGALVLLMAVLYPLLPHMGQPHTLLPLIRPYYITILLSIPFQCYFNTYKQFLDGVGDTRSPMWVMISANLLNIIGNALLIYGIPPFPQMGLLGAGTSTLLSRIYMAIAIYMVFRLSARHKVYQQYHTTPPRHLLAQLHRMGLPVALQLCMETSAFALCAVMQGWMGEAPLAAHQIMTQISSLCFMVYYGIGTAVAVRVSHFHGMGDLPNSRRSAHAGMGIIVVCGTIIATAIASAIAPISRIFTDSVPVQQIIVAITLPFVLYQLGDGLQICYSNALRGMADTRRHLPYAFVSYVLISLPLSYALCFVAGLGPVGIWAAFPIGLTTAGVLFTRRFMRLTR